MRTSLFATLCLVLSTPALAGDLSCDAPLYAVDAKGATTHGDAANVVAAVERGDALRVGWRIRFGEEPDAQVTHFADATFVTVFEGVASAQVAAITRQNPKRGEAKILLGDEPQLWHGLLETSGRLTGRFSTEGKPHEMRVEQLWCLADAAAQRCATPQWRELYRHDADGKSLAGDKRALFDAIRRGDSIRLTWGGAFESKGKAMSVEHQADPVFVSIAGGTEAYAQLAEHIGQRTYWEPGQAQFDDPKVLWRGVLGTDGSFDAAMVDRASGNTVRRLPQRAAIRWLAYAPDPACDARPVPTLAVQGGVKLDEARRGELVMPPKH